MKVLFVFLFFLSFEAAASFVAQPVAVPLQDVHVIDAITIGPDGTLTGAISGNPVFNGNVTFAGDGTQAVTAIQSDGTTIISIDTTRPDAAHTDPPIVVDITPNGFESMAGSGNQIIVLRMRAKIGTGTQSGRLRGFDSVVTLGGDATQTGTGASAFRGANMSVAQKSTNTAAELVGLNSTILSGDADATTTGTVTQATAYSITTGFQTGTDESDNGSYSKTNGILINTPQNTSATRTITTNAAIQIDDQEATGITNAWAIKTGSGEVEFGGGITQNHLSVDNDYTLDDNDYLVGIASTASPKTIVIPTTVVADGKAYIIKDESGNASVNNITVLTQGTMKIDGADLLTINTNHGVSSIYCDGIDWFTQ